MTYLFNRLAFRKLTEIHVLRYSSKKADHWSVLAKKKTNVHKALKHFDEFYGNVYGKSWQNIRKALLMENQKYVAIVNTYSDIERTKSELESQGAMNLKSIYDVYKEDIDTNPKSKKKKKKSSKHRKTLSIIADAQRSTVQSHYPEDCAPISVNTEENEDENLIQKDQALQPIKMKSIEPDLNKIELDINRIIEPNSGLSGMYEFVPATKLKGMDDWILESQHYNYCKENGDFSIKIAKEAILNFPQYLNVYTFEQENNSEFPSPKEGSTGVLDYYVMDGASILPILALDLQPGDIVLDMCAAPGEKTLTMLQTLMPSMLITNDIMKSKVNKIRNIVNQFLADMGQWDNRLIFTERDARFIDDKNIYNKILVDVPCTTDRHVLHSEDNNIFKSQRTHERLQIPELQSEILINALKIIAVGGTVVYSTCSLSPIQNDGVVDVALKKIWKETDSVMVIKDMSPALEPLKYFYKFDDYRLKYGHIAIPTMMNNWGPIYFCKIMRIQ